MENIECSLQEEVNFAKKIIELNKKSDLILSKIKTSENLEKAVSLFQDYINVEDEIKKMAYLKINDNAKKAINSFNILNDKALGVLDQVKDFKSKKNFKLLMFEISTVIFAIAFILKCFNVM